MTKTIGALRRQAYDYLVLVYGEEHVKRSRPEDVASHLLTQWVKAVADGDAEAGQRIMRNIERAVRRDRAGTEPL
jgi:hypothetical protein